MPKQLNFQITDEEYAALKAQCRSWHDCSPAWLARAALRVATTNFTDFSAVALATPSVQAITRTVTEYDDGDFCALPEPPKARYPDTAESLDESQPTDEDVEAEMQRTGWSVQ